MSYCIYLRKSRADIESETNDEIETLARHERILLDLAKRNNYDITEIYREIVSGDTIAVRPYVQKLLADVEDNLYDGVLVVDIDRLARGDTVDQGIIARTFKYSNTKIITPSKVYNPNNEFDEEYFEFGLFMARREYKMITRRMQRGRISSAKEGKFIGSEPPYGYDKIKLENQKGYSLAINKEQSKIIKLIFDLFVNGEIQADGNLKRLGSTLIARKLNHLKMNRKKWLPTTVRDILKNPVYIGKIRTNTTPSVKKSVEGNITTVRVRNKIENWTVTDGLHEPIIDLTTWEQAQTLIHDKKISPVRTGLSIKNPLAGLIFCGKCGKAMIRHVYRKDSEQIICYNIECGNSASMLKLLENKILKSLEIHLADYNIKYKDSKIQTDKNSEMDMEEKALRNIEGELTELEQQLENIHELLEKGIYTTDKFLERSRIISSKIEYLRKECDNYAKKISLIDKKIRNQYSLTPKIKKIIDVYKKLQSPEEKNNLLKEVIEKIVYTREKGGRWEDSENFKIELYFRIS